MNIPRRALLLLAGALAGLFLTSCANKLDNRNKMIVSVRDQQMLLLRDGEPVKSYKISTSKFGVGDVSGSNRTPLGKMRVVKKIGDGYRAGSVFKSRRATGEVIKANAPGRDPIISRILWLSGTQRHNRNAFRRYIYIHGTPEHSRLGQPASYGCIRMGRKDVIDLYRRVGIGSQVEVVRGSIRADLKKHKLVVR